MNLLKVQDALKNASDQQLMALMQAPDSTAPSYLVLSEIRRRKDMRSKQAPEGQSNRTVADELLAQDDGGIRDIVAHDEPEVQDGAEEMAAGGLASLRRYREGGVVRMQAGGDIMGDIPFPTSNYEDMTVPPAFGGPGPSQTALPDYQTRLAAAQREFRARVEQDPRVRTDSVLQARIAQQFNVPLTFARDFQRQEGIRIAREGPAIVGGRGDVAPLGADAPMRPQIAALAEDEPRRGTLNIPTPMRADGPDMAGPQPPAAQPPAARPARPAAAQPAPAPAARPQGIEALRPGSTEGAEQPQSSVQFADRLSPLFARMQEGRVDPSARRNEAMNMALIEAGLRIASSRNPSLAGAIGEGAAPAVQAYSQQLGQIRQDQRQDLRDELQGALAQNQNDYYRGRLSQQEFATRQQMIIERLRQDREDTRTGLREAGATARNTATVAASNRSPEAQRLWQFMFPGQEFNPNNPAHMEGMNRIIGRGRDPDAAADLAAFRASEQRQQALVNRENRSTARLALVRAGNREPSDADIDAWIVARIGSGSTVNPRPAQGAAQPPNAGAVRDFDLSTGNLR